MRARRQRMVFVIVVVAGVALAAGLAFLGLGENLRFFFSPSQVARGEVPVDQTVRVGGLVVVDSVQRGSELRVQFALTDEAQTMRVRYEGILPDLFREGQGIVAVGQMRADGVFEAQQVLAKHDENYMPPDVADALEIARKGGGMPGTSTGGAP